MITLITGSPGTGKSAALVSLLKELSKGRTIYANGIPDLKIDHQELVEPEQWMRDVPDGSIIVIDEVQRIWRPRGPGQKVPADVAALETHRHRGIDFYIVTQGPRLVDANVRALVGRHVHLRDIGVLGRWWYEWPECADQCASSWRNAPIKKRYRLPKTIFTEYKSASIHVKPIRSFPTMLVVMVLALGVTGYLGFRTWGMIAGKVHPAALAAPGSLPQAGAVAFNTTPPPPSAPVFIDDRIAFTPRLSDKPETAPAYDSLRVVVNMPRIAGAVCMKGECRCLSQQGTVLDVSSKFCQRWLERPAFDPYTVQPVSVPARAETVAARTPSAEGQTWQQQQAPVSAGPVLDVLNARDGANPTRPVQRAAQAATTQSMDGLQKMPALSLQNPYRRS